LLVKPKDLLQENQLMRQKKNKITRTRSSQRKSVDVTKKTKTTPTRSSQRKSVDATKKKTTPTRSPRKIS